MALTTRASLMNRSMTFGSDANAGCSTFTATRLPMTGCFASKMAPIPPVPIRETTS